MKNQKHIEAYQDLFEYLHDEHDLILLQSEKDEIIDLTVKAVLKYNETSEDSKNPDTKSKRNKHIVKGSDLKPPIGLMPKEIYKRNSRVKRFNDVCGAITRYYDAGLPIKIEWVNEYNELVSCVGEHCC